MKTVELGAEWCEAVFLQSWFWEQLYLERYQREVMLVIKLRQDDDVLFMECMALLFVMDYEILSDSP